MATIVKINTNITARPYGYIQDINASYWDPLTGVNLNYGNQSSSDISGFSNAQLINIANAVSHGVLILVSGSLPAATEAFSTYSNFASGGLAGGAGWTGISGVAAASQLQPLNMSQVGQLTGSVEYGEMASYSFVSSSATASGVIDPETYPISGGTPGVGDHVIDIESYPQS